MDAATPNGNGREMTRKASANGNTQLPDEGRAHRGGRGLLGDGLLITGAILIGLLLSCTLFSVFASFVLDTALGTFAESGGLVTAIKVLQTVAICLTLPLLPLLPIALALGAATRDRDPVSGRGLRDWAGAMGIITGVMLALDPLAMVASVYLASTI
jgi:hypothetical protein